MAVSTIKSSGGDYTTLSAWEAAQAATLTAPAEAECYDFALDEGTGGVGIAGITTSAANYLRIYTPTAERHDGRFRSVSGGGFRVTSSNSVGTIRDSVQHLRLEGLEIQNTDTAGQTVAKLGAYSAGANDHRIESCILHDAATGTNYTIGASTANLVLRLRNCIVVGSRRSIDVRAAASVEMSNCTFWRRADQIGVAADTESTITNCYSGKASGSSADFYTGDGTPSGTNNASSDTSAFGTGQVDSVAGADVFTSVTSGSEDFTLVAGTNALVDAGADLSGSFTVDIIGTTRPQGSDFDIGAFERAGSGTQTISPSGVASITALGQPTVTTGRVVVSPSGIASVTALGQPTISPRAVTISPAGIDSVSALGQPTVTTGRVVISPNGIDGVSAVGQPTITQPGGLQTISVTGIASVTALGQPTVSRTNETQIIGATGIDSPSAVGRPSIQNGGLRGRQRHRGRIRRRFPDPALAPPESRAGLGLPEIDEAPERIDLEPIRARYADLAAAEAAVARLTAALDALEHNVRARARREMLEARLTEAYAIAEMKRREVEDEEFIIMAA